MFKGLKAISDVSMGPHPTSESWSRRSPMMQCCSSLHPWGQQLLVQPPTLFWEKRAPFSTPRDWSRGSFPLGKPSSLGWERKAWLYPDMRERERERARRLAQSMSKVSRRDSQEGEKTCRGGVGDLARTPEPRGEAPPTCGKVWISSAHGFTFRSTLTLSKPKLFTTFNPRAIELQM